MQIFVSCEADFYLNEKQIYRLWWSRKCVWVRYTKLLQSQNITGNDSVHFKSYSESVNDIISQTYYWLSYCSAHHTVKITFIVSIMHVSVSNIKQTENKKCSFWKEGGNYCTNLRKWVPSTQILIIYVPAFASSLNSYSRYSHYRPTR